MSDTKLWIDFFYLDPNAGPSIKLLVFDNEDGYSLEIRQQGKLLTGMRFLYNEKVHNIALCLGGIVYDLFKNADLAESMIKAIEDNLGGYELST